MFYLTSIHVHIALYSDLKSSTRSVMPHTENKEKTSSYRKRSLIWEIVTLRRRAKNHYMQFYPLWGNILCGNKTFFTWNLHEKFREQVSFLLAVAVNRRVNFTRSSCRVCDFLYRKTFYVVILIKWFIHCIFLLMLSREIDQ